MRRSLAHTTYNFFLSVHLGVLQMYADLFCDLKNEVLARAYNLQIFSVGTFGGLAPPPPHTKKLVTLVVENRFLSTCWVKFHPDSDNCRQNNGQEINAVMLISKIQTSSFMRWIIGTGWVNSGGLSVKHAAAFAWQRAFRKQSSLFEGFYFILCF